MALAGCRAEKLTQNLRPSPNGPFVKSPSTRNPEFSSTLETAVLSEDSRSIATALQTLGLKDGFKLFALPGIDRIDSDHELDAPSHRRLQLIYDEADPKGWAIYIVRVRAVHIADLPTDSTSILAQLEDEESGFLRNLGAAEEAGTSEFQIMSVSDLDGTEVIPPYDEDGDESRLRFQSSHRFVQKTFFQRHHLDEPKGQGLGNGTRFRRWTWSRDAVLLISRAKVWDLLAPTIRPFFMRRNRAMPRGWTSQYRCEDNALKTLASHFFNNATDPLNDWQTDKSRHENACAAARVLLEAQPTSQDDIYRSLLVSVLTYSYIHSEWFIFISASDYLAGYHETVTAQGTAVREIAPYLADGPPGLLQAFAVESLNRFLTLHEVKDFISRLEAVKSFPQDLLPCNFTTAPIRRDVLTLVLGANEFGLIKIDREQVEKLTFDSLWTFRHGEALADAILAYGPGSKYERTILCTAGLGGYRQIPHWRHNSLVMPRRQKPQLNPLVMGFITRLGKKPEGESDEKEAERRQLQADVTETFVELAMGEDSGEDSEDDSGDDLDITVRENRPAKFSMASVSGSLSMNLEDFGKFMDPTNLALFISAVASFAHEQELQALLQCLTPSCMELLNSQKDFEEFEGFWLPFWSCLVKMGGIPLKALSSTFLANLENYCGILDFSCNKMDHHPRVEAPSAHSPNRSSESPGSASNTLDTKILDWLADPNSPAGLTATSSLRILEKYHGLHGEYLSSRVTPIPGTGKAQLLIVKRIPNPPLRGHNPENKFEPTIRGELE
ncbi:hypothetical protein QBC39DRAFT_26265 [Podospora conica]|nr:hypothetical protein QBC39DRAFT_26265 [Schizothecium conicum]